MRRSTSICILMLALSLSLNSTWAGGDIGEIDPDPAAGGVPGVTTLIPTVTLTALALPVGYASILATSFFIHYFWGDSAVDEVENTKSTIDVVKEACQQARSYLQIECKSMTLDWHAFTSKQTKYNTRNTEIDTILNLDGTRLQGPHQTVVSQDREQECTAWKEVKVTKTMVRQVACYELVDIDYAVEKLCTNMSGWTTYYDYHDTGRYKNTCDLEIHTGLPITDSSRP